VCRRHKVFFSKKSWISQWRHWSNHRIITKGTRTDWIIACTKEGKGLYGGAPSTRTIQTLSDMRYKADYAQSSGAIFYYRWNKTDNKGTQNQTSLQSRYSQILWESAARKRGFRPPRFHTSGYASGSECVTEQLTAWCVHVQITRHEQAPCDGRQGWRTFSTKSRQQHVKNSSSSCRPTRQRVITH